MPATGPFDLQAATYTTKIIGRGVANKIMDPIQIMWSSTIPYLPPGMVKFNHFVCPKNKDSREVPTIDLRLFDNFDDIQDTKPDIDITQTCSTAMNKDKAERFISEDCIIHNENDNNSISERSSIDLTPDKNYTKEALDGSTDSQKITANMENYDDTGIQAKNKYEKADIDNQHKELELFAKLFSPNETTTKEVKYDSKDLQEATENKNNCENDNAQSNIEEEKIDTTEILGNTICSDEIPDTKDELQFKDKIQFNDT